MRTSDVTIIVCIVILFLGIIFSIVLLMRGMTGEVAEESICEKICTRKGHDYIRKEIFRMDPCGCLTKSGEVLWFPNR